VLGAGRRGVAISGIPDLVLSMSTARRLPPRCLRGRRATSMSPRRVRSRLGSHGDELLPKLLWLRAERPDLLGGRVGCSYPQDHLVFRLTGNTCSTIGRQCDRAPLRSRPTLAWRLDVRAYRAASDALPELRRAGCDTPAQ